MKPIINAEPEVDKVFYLFLKEMENLGRSEVVFVRSKEIGFARKKAIC